MYSQSATLKLWLFRFFRPSLYYSLLLIFFSLSRLKALNSLPLIFCSLFLFFLSFGFVLIWPLLVNHSIIKVYNTQNPFIAGSVPDDFNNFCVGTGFLNIASELAQLIYNLVFCLYYINKIKNPLKCKKWFKSAWVS